jgi:hypothetical protein
MAVLQDLLTRKSEAITGIPEGDPKFRIREALVRLHGFLVEHPSYTRILAWEFAALCPILNNENFNIARQVEALVQSGEAAGTDPVWFGVTAVSAVMSSDFWQAPLEGMPAISAEDVADSILRML